MIATMIPLIGLIWSIVDVLAVSQTSIDTILDLSPTPTIVPPPPTLKIVSTIYAYSLNCSQAPTPANIKAACSTCDAAVVSSAPSPACLGQGGAVLCCSTQLIVSAPSVENVSTLILKIRNGEVPQVSGASTIFLGGVLVHYSSQTMTKPLTDAFSQRAGFATTECWSSSTASCALSASSQTFPNLAAGPTSMSNAYVGKFNTGIVGACDVCRRNSATDTSPPGPAQVDVVAIPNSPCNAGDNNCCKAALQDAWCNDRYDLPSWQVELQTCWCFGKQVSCPSCSDSKKGLLLLLLLLWLIPVGIVLAVIVFVCCKRRSESTAAPKGLLVREEGFVAETAAVNVEAVDVMGDTNPATGFELIQPDDDM